MTPAAPAAKSQLASAKFVCEVHSHVSGLQDRKFYSEKKVFNLTQSSRFPELNPPKANNISQRAPSSKLYFPRLGAPEGDLGFPRVIHFLPREGSIRATGSPRVQNCFAERGSSNQLVLTNRFYSCLKRAIMSLSRHCDLGASGF